MPEEAVGLDMEMDLDIDMENLDDLPELSLNPSAMSEVSDTPSL